MTGNNVSNVLFGPGWQTSVAGYILAGIHAAQALHGFQSGHPTSSDWYQVALAVGMAILGRFVPAGELMASPSTKSTTETKETVQP